MTTNVAPNFAETDLTGVEAASKQAVVSFLISIGSFPEDVPTVLHIFDNTELYWHWKVSDQMVGRLNAARIYFRGSGLSQSDRAVARALLKSILAHKRNDYRESIEKRDKISLVQRLKKIWQVFTKIRVSKVIGFRSKEVVDSDTQKWNRFMQYKKSNTGALAVVILDQMGSPQPAICKQAEPPKLDPEKTLAKDYMILFEAMFNALQIAIKEKFNDSDVTRYRVKLALGSHFQDPQEVFTAMKVVLHDLETND